MGKYVFFALIIAAAAGLYMTRDGAFDYAKADTQSRADFIERTATRLASRNSVKQHEMAKVIRIVPRVSGKSVRIEIDLVLGLPNSAQHKTTPAQRKERACKAYLGSPLGKVGIRTTVALKLRNRVVESLTLNPRTCQQLAG